MVCGDRDVSTKRHVLAVKTLPSGNNNREHGARVECVGPSRIEPGLASCQMLGVVGSPGWATLHVYYRHRHSLCRSASPSRPPHLSVSKTCSKLRSYWWRPWPGVKRPCRSATSHIGQRVHGQGFLHIGDRESHSTAQHPNVSPDALRDTAPARCVTFRSSPDILKGSRQARTWLRPTTGERLPGGREDGRQTGPRNTAPTIGSPPHPACLQEGGGRGPPALL